MKLSRSWVPVMLAALPLLTVASPQAPEVPRALFHVAEEAAFLGVHLEEEIDHPEGGARVSGVVDGSPAAEAGLEEGDIVVGFDGDVIRGPVALTRKIHARKPGDSVSIDVVRGGREISLKAELSERRGANLFFGDGEDRLGRLHLLAPEVDEEALEKLYEGIGRLEKLDLPNLQFAPDIASWSVAPDCEGEDCRFFGLLGNSRPVLGVELVETTAELRHHLGGSDDEGVLIGKVLAGMPAAAAGLQVGDLILRVGGDPVRGTRDLRRALGERSGASFDLEIVRDGRAETLTVTLPDVDEGEPTGPRAWTVRPPAPVAPAVFRVRAPRVRVARPVPPIAPVAPRLPRQLRHAI